MLLVLYRADGNAFIPTQTMHDLQMAIKNEYFSVAKFKVDNPDGSYYIILNGYDSLEAQFGEARTINGNDRSFDQYQLGNRLEGAAECDQILRMHPEWRQHPDRRNFHRCRPKVKTGLGKDTIIFHLTNGKAILAFRRSTCSRSGMLGENGRPRFCEKRNWTCPGTCPS